MGVNPKGRNWGPIVNWDDLGKFYASFAIVWTVILSVGMGWLILHRHQSFLKIRNIPLAIAATCTLHVYLLKILFAYTVNGHFSCTAEFWIMSIYLPFGIALFQANLVQLQSISGQQKKFLDGQLHPIQAEIQRRHRGLRGIWMRWCAMTEVKRTEILIAVGMVSQLIVTTVIYLCSRKFHGSWGVVSQGHVKAPICRKGWEWIPSTIWQLVWAWFYGPYILYKIRNIHDVHYWRIQTTLCVISGLPGTPLWLAAVYSPAFKYINRFWVPPMWLTPGIITMQLVTVFFPIFEAYSSRHHLRSTLNIVKSWEEKKKTKEAHTYSNSTGDDSAFSVGRPASSSPSTSASSRRKGLYTMGALEKALAMNAIPLLHFAATKEFTGENIVFLMQVRDWRAAWNRWHRDLNVAVTGQVRHHLFNIAVEIFAASVSTKTAEFPINIESRIRGKLEAVFGATVLDMKREQHHNDNVNVVAPFMNPAPAGNIEVKSPKAFDQDGSMSGYSNSVHALPRSQSQEMILPLPSPTKSTDVDVQLSEIQETFTTPVGFDEHIFDDSERSVKYMVLTNTWPKFVDHMTCEDHDALVGNKT